MSLLESLVDIEVPNGPMPGFLVRPENPGSLPAVMVMMEAAGLNAHIKNVARRIAAEGYVALVADYYWRGGKLRSVPYDAMADALRMMDELYALDGTRRGDWLTTDMGAVVSYLKAQPFVRPDRLGVTGFCLGGRVTIDIACEFPRDIAAAAPFYGAGIPFDSLHQLRCPLLGFYGALDFLIPVADVERLRSQLAAQGNNVEVVIYPGAGHGFFCDDRPESYHPEAAHDAWRRLKAFLSEHLKS